MENHSDTYLKALEAAKLELVEVTAFQERLEKRKIVLRKAIETFTSLADADGEASLTVDGVLLLENQSLPDEIRNILKSLYPAWATPNRIMGELKQMGRDLSNYNNPQSAIQTILKRMAESSSDPTEELAQADGKKQYRCQSTSHQLAEAFGVAPAALAAYGLDLSSEVKAQMDVAQKMQERIQDDVRKQMETAKRVIANEQLEIAKVLRQERTPHVGSGTKPK